MKNTKLFTKAVFVGAIILALGFAIFQKSKAKVVSTWRIPEFHYEITFLDDNTGWLTDEDGYVKSFTLKSADGMMFLSTGEHFWDFGVFDYGFIISSSGDELIVENHFYNELTGVERSLIDGFDFEGKNIIIFTKC
ncbi:MAG: hypothetical protein IKP86_10380 [Anaerolineaceae bacterium]|nr:hypothetical protein [Anaerolineaceae bacterium]